MKGISLDLQFPITIYAIIFDDNDLIIGLKKYTCYNRDQIFSIPEQFDADNNIPSYLLQTVQNSNLYDLFKWSKEDDIILWLEFENQSVSAHSKVEKLQKGNIVNRNVVTHEGLNISYPHQIFVTTFDENDYILDLKSYTCNNIEETTDKIKYLIYESKNEQFSSCIIQICIDCTLYRFIEVNSEDNIIWEKYICTET